jgi:hypothetical protein
MTQLDRRHFLIGAATAGAAAVVLDPVEFAYADAGDQARTLTGHIAYGAPDWVYIPVVVPAGVSRITISYGYDRPVPPPGYDGNALDIGVFDEGGIELGSTAGFRGWSGGFRTEFTISASDATPGYLPGPVRPGTWHVIVGPYKVAPQGLNWTATVTMSFGPPGPPFVPHRAPLRAAGRCARPAGAGRGIAATCTCTPCTRTAGGPPRRWRPAPGPPGWTTSCPPITTRPARPVSGATSPGRTC